MPDTSNKRTKLQVIEDREFICRHYLRGIPHSKIADMLVVELKRSYVLSRQQIEYDIGVIVKALQEHYEERIGVVLFEQLRKIDEMEGEAWAAWDASKKARKRTTIITKKNQVKAEPGEAEPPKDPQDVIIEQTDQTGDIRYFDKIQWCVETRLKLLGFFRINQYAKTLDDGGAGADQDQGVIIFLPDNGRNDESKKDYHLRRDHRTKKGTGGAPQGLPRLGSDEEIDE